MTKKNIVCVIILLALIMFDVCYMVNKFIAKENTIAAQQTEIEDLRRQIAVLADENAELQTELAVEREENVALREELDYLHYLLEDPMLLFGNGCVEITPEEEIELMEIAMAEAGNQGVVGKMLVMNTVLNRCERDEMSIHDVIYAPNQYYTVGMGGYDVECEIALILVSAGWDGSQGAIYFCNHGYNAYGDTQLFRYRGHWFSR